MADRAEAGMAAGQGQQAIDGVSRRRVLRSGLLAGAGVVTAGAMSAVLTGTARAATPEPQPGWAWCEYCATMFWAADESTSWCASPSHTQHSYRKGAYNYELYNGYGGLNNNSNPQPYWRYCDYCQGAVLGPVGQTILPRKPRPSRRRVRDHLRSLYRLWRPGVLALVRQLRLAVLGRLISSKRTGWLLPCQLLPPRRRERYKLLRGLGWHLLMPAAGQQGGQDSTADDAGQVSWAVRADTSSMHTLTGWARCRRVARCLRGEAFIPLDLSRRFYRPLHSLPWVARVFGTRRVSDHRVCGPTAPAVAGL
jgi:hypothetical protein